SSETTIDFSTPGTNYKGRIQYNNTTNAFSLCANSSATTSLVLTDSTTANTIVCNSFEPTTVNTDKIIKANTVLFGYTLTHTSLSGSSSNFYSEANIYQYLRAKNGCVSGYDNEVGVFSLLHSQLVKLATVIYTVILMWRTSNSPEHLQQDAG
ncbi:MAG: hypothetical protein ACKPKO_19935, partial [Candidatus Fonsibacter sp.]